MHVEHGRLISAQQAVGGSGPDNRTVRWTCLPQVFPNYPYRAAGGLQRWSHDRTQQRQGKGGLA
jgi:hypothetical protein